MEIMSQCEGGQSPGADLNQRSANARPFVLYFIMYIIYNNKYQYVMICAVFMLIGRVRGACPATGQAGRYVAEQRKAAGA